MINLNPEKSQHFLSNEKILKDEVKEADLSSTDFVVEIGAGDGRLTKEIVKRAKKVLAFEIDEKFKEDLEEIKKENKNLQVIYDSAINFSWKGYNKIVSNIPYTLSEQTINKALRDDIESLTLIVGENFKEVLSSSFTKTGLIANTFFKVRAIKKIGKNNFSPAPRVDSWLVKINKKNTLKKSEKILKTILSKNGKIKNAIMYSLVEHGLTKRQSREMIKKFNISKTTEDSIKTMNKKILLEIKENLEKSFD